MAYMKINVLKNRILFCKAIQKDIELAGKKNTIRTIFPKELQMEVL
jgi:hypothetical protein